MLPQSSPSGSLVEAVVRSAISSRPFPSASTSPASSIPSSPVSSDLSPVTVSWLSRVGRSSVSITPFGGRLGARIWSSLTRPRSMCSLTLEPWVASPRMRGARIAGLWWSFQSSTQISMNCERERSSPTWSRLYVSPVHIVSRGAKPVGVDDWNDHHNPAIREPRIRGDATPGSSVKLHIDLGRVSEDQMRAPNRPPNGVIDTEDRPTRDNQLTVTGDKSEDTGLDGIDDAGEVDALGKGLLEIADLTTASTSDPEGDDWGNIVETFPSAVDPRRYQRTNGTEGNHTAYPIPDTEDLNLNGNPNGRAIPDTSEAYFEYTIDLGDRSSPYLVTDVLRDFPGSTVSDTTKNGWRRYRIPLTDSLRVKFGFPDLTIAQHVRLWLE